MADPSSSEASYFPETALPRLAPLGDVPADFAPLCLVLEPAGLVLELKHPDLILGRHSDSDVRLPLPDVSRRHCRLFFTGGQWHAQDLKSLNGVFLNDELVVEAELRHGDRLRIGGFSFTVRLADEPQGSEWPIRHVIHDLPQIKPSFPDRRQAS